MELQKLLSKARRAAEDYDMIEEGDKIAVGLSGGKDSITLLCILAAMRRFYPKKYELIAISIDMGLGLDEKEVQAVKDLCARLNVEYIVEKTRIGEIVFDVRKEPNPCSLCANMRRGALNSTAAAHGCNKVALGHHSDDLAETFLLSLFYEGRLSAFAPVTKLERVGITVIRPMIYIDEKEIIGFAKDKPIIHNPCPADKHTKRQFIKDTIKSLQKEIPSVKDNVLGAIMHPERNNLSPFEKSGHTD